jgi:hypothetical protein
MPRSAEREPTVELRRRRRGAVPQITPQRGRGRAGPGRKRSSPRGRFDGPVRSARRKVGGDRAPETVADERWRLRARPRDQVAKPGDRHRGIKLAGRPCRLAKAGQVRSDDPVALGEPRDHESPLGGGSPGCPPAWDRVVRDPNPQAAPARRRALPRPAPVVACVRARHRWRCPSRSARPGRQVRGAVIGASWPEGPGAIAVASVLRLQAQTLSRPSEARP